MCALAWVLDLNEKVPVFGSWCSVFGASFFMLRLCAAFPFLFSYAVPYAAVCPISHKAEDKRCLASFFFFFCFVPSTSIGEDCTFPRPGDSVRRSACLLNQRRQWLDWRREGKGKGKGQR